ncbi:MAG: cbb3-type cytochrome c oxidase subunit II, partial [Paracoccus sp. (in: a-proteobacteria)]
LIDPRSVIPVSIMPAYPWLTRDLDTGLIADNLAALARLGVPYDEAMIDNAMADARARAGPSPTAPTACATATARMSPYAPLTATRRA